MSEEVTNTGSEVSVESTVDTSAEFDFKSHLSEELRSDSTIADIKDLDSLVKSYKSAQTMIGASVRIPGEDASDEQRAEFYSKLEQVPGVARLPNPDNAEEVAAFRQKMGAPTEATGYDLGLGEDTTIEGYEHLMEAAAKAGVTNDQLKILAEAEMNKNAASIEQMQQDKAAGEKAINELFGADKEARITGAKAAARIYAEKFPEQVDALLNGPAGNNPALIAMLADLGKSLSEQGHAGMKTAQFGRTPDEAKMKIEEIRNNPSHAYHNPDDSNHAEAVQRMSQFYKEAYPGQ